MSSDRGSHSPSSWMVHVGCVRIVLVCTMECTCTQTGSQFILSSDRVVGNGVRTHVNSKVESALPEGSEQG